MQFDKYSQYYDLLYSSKDYKKEADYIHSLIVKYRKRCKNILELGMGSGEHAILLEALGYHMTGIELSHTMAQRAHVKGLSCEIGDIAELKVNAQFDVVISLFHVISYITDNNKLEKTFTNAFHHLVPGGLFIFDVWYGTAVLTLKPEKRLLKAENEKIKVWRFATPHCVYNENIVNVHYEIIVEDKISHVVDTFSETHPMRYFFIPELSYILKHCGFELLKTEAFETGDPPSENTWGITFICRRPLSQNN